MSSKCAVVAQQLPARVHVIVAVRAWAHAFADVNMRMELPLNRTRLLMQLRARVLAGAQRSAILQIRGLLVRFSYPEKNYSRDFTKLFYSSLRD